MADLKGFTEKNGLNSRLVKTNGRLVEEVYKIDGRYGKQIAEIVKHLEAAIPFASEPTAAALKALIQWYRTGDDGDRAKFDIAWVKDKDAPVDTINGFIEVYMDPRGLKGSWEGVVFHVNKEKTDRSRSLPPTRSGSKTTCRTTRSTASPPSPASSPTRSTWSSRREIRDR
jgi:dipeptidyl-peptidase-3